MKITINWQVHVLIIKKVIHSENFKSLSHTKISYILFFHNLYTQFNLNIN